MSSLYFRALAISFAIVFTAMCLLSLVSCGTGAAGEYCNPDGTCSYPNLECANSGIVASVPIDRPYCRVKSQGKK